MNIDINTRFITLLGKPLSQSFAAAMQNAAYEAAGLNMAYFYSETDTEHLGEIVNGLRYMPFAGFAVTKPNKVEVLKYLDETDELCAKMGACNTVVKTADGRLKGYNTDGEGFYTAITRDAGLKVEGGRFLVIGAGGAGRAIASILAYRGAEKIWINDRFTEFAQTLADDLNRSFRAGVAEVVTVPEHECVRVADAVINASGIGMAQTADQTPLPEKFFRKDAFYFDATYNPEKTLFLKLAEKVGARTMNGLLMSLYQGVKQIELWTGVTPPVAEMRAVIEQMNGLTEKR